MRPPSGWRAAARIMSAHRAASNPARAGPASSAKTISLPEISWKIASRTARGKSAPPFVPRLFRTNWSRVILFFTCGLCWSVLSMMMEYDSTYAASASATSPPGFAAKYASANASRNREIFCASPGSRNPSRNARNAASSVAFVKSNVLTYALSTATLNSLGSPRYSPTWDLSRPGAWRRKAATAVGSGGSAKTPMSAMYANPFLGLALKWSAHAKRRRFRYRLRRSTAARAGPGIAVSAEPTTPPLASRMRPQKSSTDMGASAGGAAGAPGVPDRASASDRATRSATPAVMASSPSSDSRFSSESAVP